MNPNQNELTIASYEDNAGRYAEATRNDISGLLKDWLDGAVEGLSKDASIFEIGSGTGRDALYLHSKGYSVQCSDATEAFLLHLLSRGIDAKRFNITSDSFSNRYDLVLADAVLLHLTRVQLRDALVKVRASLAEGGRFAFTLKEGEGEAWTDKKIGKPRYFCYWSEQDIKVELEKAGYGEIILSQGGESGSSWLNIVAKTA